MSGLPQGVRVVDRSTALMGPNSTQILGDMGIAVAHIVEAVQ